MRLSDFKLPKGFKKKWIAALRSGQYKQAKGSLYDRSAEVGHDKHGNSIYGVGYCCLGVACRIQGIQNRSMFKYGLIDGKLLEKAAKHRIPKILTGDIKTDKNQGLIRNPLVDKLTTMNDAENSSFEKIANWIEKNL